MSAGEYSNQQAVETSAGLAATDTQCAAIVQQIGVRETRKWREWKCHGSLPYLICVRFLLFH
jgi:hypothetical protein